MRVRRPLPCPRTSHVTSAVERRALGEPDVYRTPARQRLQARIGDGARGVAVPGGRPAWTAVGHGVHPVGQLVPVSVRETLQESRSHRGLERERSYLADELAADVVAVT